MQNYKNKIIVSVLILLCAGCASVPVQEQYDLVKRDDGISEKEAVIIGQYELTEAALTNRFHIKKGMILDDRLVEPYPDYWFVSFYPIAYDDHFRRFLVVIDKKNGNVVRAEMYRPLRVFDYEWVFNGSQP